jgi:hypothetical protein
MAKNCDTENFFHSILAFSDTHHDFGAYIQKSELYGVYDKNVEYNKDMLTLKNYLKAVNSDVLAKKKLAEVMNERNRTLIYLARLNNLNVIRDNVIPKTPPPKPRGGGRLSSWVSSTICCFLWRSERKSTR